MGYFGKNERKKKEKKRICVGNEIKIKLGGRGGRGGADKGRERKCAPGWQLSEGTCLTREKELERDQRQAVKFYFFCYFSHSTYYRCSFLCDCSTTFHYLTVGGVGRKKKKKRVCK